MAAAEAACPGDSAAANPGAWAGLDEARAAQANCHNKFAAYNPGLGYDSAAQGNETKRP